MQLIRVEWLVIRRLLPGAAKQVDRCVVFARLAQRHRGERAAGFVVANHQFFGQMNRVGGAASVSGRQHLSPILPAFQQLYLF